MANITLSVPNDVHEDMKRFSEVKWSEVARKAIIEKIDAMKAADRIAGKSKLTKRDIEEFSKMIKKEARKRYVKE